MRSFLFGLSALAACASTAVAGSSPHDRMIQIHKRANTGSGPTDVEILNYALTLENLEYRFYFDNLDRFKTEDFVKSGYAKKVHARIQQIAIQEKTHALFLKGALGDAAVGRCKYDFSSVTSVKSFLAVARILEGVGTAAYLGAAPDITDKAYLAAAGSVLTVEARHTSYLNEVFGETGFPVPFDTSLDYAQVYSLAAPFIVPNSCGTSGSLPSAIKAFPALTVVTKVPRSGHTSAIKFARVPGVTKYYAAFLNGGQAVYREVVQGADGVQRVRVPEGLDGVTYVVITKSNAEAPNNTNTVAGPGIMFL
ncbi:hypothetical protein OIV83_002657 [Microbotryomycetes sp. JL201]|nr:hypothetical protein OIV83_002657 [Microbotryomycetes sp. JL201]